MDQMGQYIKIELKNTKLSDFSKLDVVKDGRIVIESTTEPFVFKAIDPWGNPMSFYNLAMQMVSAKFIKIKKPK